MTALLEKAIQETQTLSEAEQDFVAALLIENIQDARQWDAQFAASKGVPTPAAGTTPAKSFWSVRTELGYRALGQPEPNVVVWH